MMTTLILGASGATGKQLVEQLLIMKHKVKVVVRPTSKIPDSWINSNQVAIIKASVSDINVNDMAKYLEGCQGVASCLGHNITMKGIWGKPRRLVANAVKLVCTAIQMNSNEIPVKFVLMNTTGNRNKDLKESISLGEKLVMGLIRMLVPPQFDNEVAAEFLRVDIGQNDKLVEWVAVRPDSLINENNVSEYKVYASPIRSALSNPGKTSRINVGNFMARLITEIDLWNKWKGQMPVIYNTEA